MRAHLPSSAAKRAAVASVSTIVVLAACAAGQASPSATASAATSPTAVQSPAGQPASVTFTWPDGDQPAVTRTLTGIDRQYVNPGAVIDDGGQLHMFANVFTAWPGPVDVPHLVSSDGVTWTLASQTPVLTSDDVEFAAPGADVSSGFVAADGTWVLIIESVSATAPWVVGRATATDPAGPWTVDPVPVLQPGAAGSWDAGGIDWPSVVHTADGYLMFYAGFDSPGGHGAIGLATSPDGVTWTKHDGPVLTPVAAWELSSLDRPRVAATPAGLVMVYAGRQLTDRGLAWSDDGITWRRDGDLPVITRASFPIDGNAWDAAVTYRDGTITYYLEIGGVGADGTNVYRATANLPSPR
jgi:predicted GH43/DUF377 family glycosyl hydrolase